MAGLFAAGGTGEFFSLTPAEVVDVVTTAVQQTAGRVPVLAGIGYGTAMATELAGAVERAGADGMLLLPPYLVSSEQAGLADHVEAVCKATSLGVIVYNRDNAILTEDTIAQLCDAARTLSASRTASGTSTDDAHPLAHGRPADLCRRIAHRRTFALPYLEWASRPIPPPCSISCRNSRPNSTRRCGGATGTVQAGLRDFVLPLLAIRNRKRGYAVSMIKAGMKVIGRDSGPVRSPLTDLTSGEVEELSVLVSRLKASEFASRSFAVA